MSFHLALRLGRNWRRSRRRPTRTRTITETRERKKTRIRSMKSREKLILRCPETYMPLSLRTHSHALSGLPALFGCHVALPRNRASRSIRRNTLPCRCALTLKLCVSKGQRRARSVDVPPCHIAETHDLIFCFDALALHKYEGALVQRIFALNGQNVLPSCFALTYKLSPNMRAQRALSISLVQ